MRPASAVGSLLALAAALVLRRAVGEWVQVPVIDGRKGPHDSQGSQSPQGPQGPPSPPRQPVPSPADGATMDHIGPPGTDSLDVYTIRRTVGDSFSNKEAVVLAPQSHGDDTEATVDDAEQREGLEDEGLPEPEGDLPLRELREAHQTLLKQSRAPVSGKLDFLRRLKNRLLRHIASLVPLSARSLVGLAGSNGGRAAEGRGHKGVGFPSNEGTLMSLAFLVFAVFLVKVVMQLIYAVQNSQNNNAGVRVAQMQIPDNMIPGAMGSMMGTMMNMMPAMMPPMMAAMNPAMGMRGRARRLAEAPSPADALVERMAARVLDAVSRARARLGERVAE